MIAVFFTLIGVLAISLGITTTLQGDVFLHQIHGQLITITGVLCIAVAVLGDISRKLGK